MVEYALLASFIAVTLSAAFPAASTPWARLASKVAKTVALAAGVSGASNC